MERVSVTFWFLGIQGTFCVLEEGLDEVLCSLDGNDAYETLVLAIRYAGSKFGIFANRDLINDEMCLEGALDGLCAFVRSKEDAFSAKLKEVGWNRESEESMNPCLFSIVNVCVDNPVFIRSLSYTRDSAH